MVRKYLIILFVILPLYLSTGQNNFLINDNTNYTTIPFKLVNNLIILEVTVNDIPLNLILDTGIKQTVLINLKDKTKEIYKNYKTSTFVGTGNDKKNIQAIKSVNNKIEIAKKLSSNDAELYFITNTNFNFSETLGIPIYGFIGGDLLKNFIVKIDYKKNILTFYNHKNFDYSKIRKYRKLSIKLRKDKPYLVSKIKFGRKSEEKRIKLLIDTGNSDALWLFETDKLKIPSNQKRIKDYFGIGFNGEINGNRIKLKQINIDKKIKFKNVYTALPDSIYFINLIRQNRFDGIIGGEILNRFRVILDYKNKNLYLKKIWGKYRKDFHFNDSGMHLVYAGKIPVKIKKILTNFDQVNPNENRNTFVFTESEIVYEYQFVNKIVINYIRPNSPAYKSGFLKGDVLLKINGQNVYEYKLNELEKKFFYKTGKNLKFLILRNNNPIVLKLQNDAQF